MSEAAELELLKLGRFHLSDGIERAAESLREYGHRYSSWVVAFSGGKDSTALATLVAWLIETGAVPRPQDLYLAQIDTLAEMPPLHAHSYNMATEMKRRGWNVIRRSPKPLERMWVQMLGRGLPPANQQGDWWCTRSMKKAPQDRLYKALNARHPGGLLTLYGSRIDESDARAERIAKSCTAAGTECGLALFSTMDDRLAPLVGWRNCAVWDWLMICKRRTGIDVSSLIEAYAADDAQQATFDWDSKSDEEKDRIATEWDIEIDRTARTGCVNCLIAARGKTGDRALNRLAKTAAWGHLAPYRKLQAVTDALRDHINRVENPRTGGAGALQLQARLRALEEVLVIQNEVRLGAERAGKPHFDLISPNDEAMIRMMIERKTFPSNYEIGIEPPPMTVREGVEIVPLAGQLEIQW